MKSNSDSGSAFTFGSSFFLILGILRGTVARACFCFGLLNAGGLFFLDLGTTVVRITVCFMLTRQRYVLVIEVYFFSPYIIDRGLIVDIVSRDFEMKSQLWLWRIIIGILTFTYTIHPSGLLRIGGLNNCVVMTS